MAQYLISVLNDSTELATDGGDGRDRRLQRRSSSPTATGSSPGASRRPTRPPSSTAGTASAVFTDGPFLESKEFIVGFWIIEAADLDVALRLAAPGLEGLQPEGRGAPVPPARRRKRASLTSMTTRPSAIARAHREEWARVVATLARRFGDLDIAEEMAAEAFAAAVERWPADGVPPSPGAWLTTTADRKAIDRIRREAKRGEKHKEALMLSDTPEPLGVIDDDRLRLVFTCCHPALAMEARVALTLRMVGGLTVPEIARAFLVQETAMGRRITRAKAKIKAARIPYRVPSREDLAARVTGVLAVLYLIFNEGYLASDPGEEAVRGDLTAEAIRLTRLVRELMPADGEVAGLLALMLLTEARRAARVSAGGELVDPRRAGPRRLGPRADRRGPRAGPGAPRLRPGAGALPDPRRDQRRPHRRPRRPRHRLVAGHRALRPARPSSTARRSCGSTGRSRSPSSTARRSRWRSLTACPSTATAPSTPPAPTCCAGWAGATRRGPRTGRAIDLAGNTAETAHLIRRRDQLAGPSTAPPAKRRPGPADGPI